MDFNQKKKKGLPARRKNSKGLPFVSLHCTVEMI